MTATVQPGRYRHYKGNEYTVLGVARHSETLDELVVYRQEYGEHGLWVRPSTKLVAHARMPYGLPSYQAIAVPLNNAYAI